MYLSKEEQQKVFSETNYTLRKKYNTEIKHSNREEIKKLLFGRRIVRIDNLNELVLDNGIILKIHPNEGCMGCGSGDYFLKQINICENAITDIEFVGEEYDEIFQIFVLTIDERIKILEVEGDAGNGYYGSGYKIYVNLKKEEVQ